MDPFTIVSLISEFAPTVVGWFSDDEDDKKKAEGVVDVVKRVTGIANPEEAAAAIRADGAMQAKFKEMVLTYQFKFEQEKTKQIEAVNRTMQAEAKSEHWMQWAWRPFNGFLFGITLFLGYIVPALTNVWLAAGGYTNKIITAAPFEGMAPIVNEVARTVPYAQIPEFVLVAWGAILGVTSWWRGKGKTTAIEQTPPA